MSNHIASSDISDGPASKPSSKSKVKGAFGAAPSTPPWATKGKGTKVYSMKNPIVLNDEFEAAMNVVKQMSKKPDVTATQIKKAALDSSDEPKADWDEDISWNDGAFSKAEGAAPNLAYNAPNEGPAVHLEDLMAVQPMPAPQVIQGVQGFVVAEDLHAEPNILPFVAPAPHANPAPNHMTELKKIGSLKSFVAGDLEFESGGWTYERIMEGISAENWRARDIDETIREGDLVHRLGDTPDTFVVERVYGYKDQVFTQELSDYHQMGVYTLEGGGKKKAPPHGKTTADFRCLYDVPKGMRLDLPTSEDEAKRFFATEVMTADEMRKGKVTKVFFPAIPEFSDRKLRVAFSQTFETFAKKQLRDSLKGIIRGRGDGIRLKRWCSTKDITKTTASIWPATVAERPTIESVCQGVKAQMASVKSGKDLLKLKAKLSAYQHMDEQTFDTIIKRNDYRPRGTKALPFDAFITRMNSRILEPNAFRYDKAVGIEIETLCPLDLTEEERHALSQTFGNQISEYGAKFMQSHLSNPKGRMFARHGALPSYVRVGIDKSIKDRKGNDAHLGTERGEYGVEWRILIKRSEMETRIGRALEYINRLGCSVNQSCGLHVHFDMRDKTESEVKAIADKVTRWHKALIELIPASRRDNKHCKLENFEKPHWAGVSMDAYKKYKTLEIRTHSSTTSLIKIVRWINLMERLIEIDYLPPANLKMSTVDALKMLRLPEADKAYWLKRHQQLNKEQYKVAKGEDGKLVVAPKLDLSFLDKPDEVE